MILARQHLCHYAARAMSYLEVYRLSRAQLLELARPFPIALRRIRWEAVRLAILRTMVSAKHELQALIRADAAPTVAASTSIIARSVVGHKDHGTDDSDVAVPTGAQEPRYAVQNGGQRGKGKG